MSIPTGAGPDSGSTATSDHGAGPLGFAGTAAQKRLGRNGFGHARRRRLRRRPGDADGAGQLERRPGRRGGTRRRARLMRQRSPGVDAELSLAWLLEPLSVETFLDEIWGKDHHHVKRPPGSFDALLPGPSTVDGLLELFRHEPSALRLVRGKDKKGPDNYRLADGSLDLAGVRNDFADGYTIVLDGVEQYVRTIGTLARSLEVELNFPTQVNTYITPPQSDRAGPALRRPRRVDPADSGIQDLASVRRRRPAATRDPARQGQSGCPRKSSGANGCAPGSRRRAVRAARPRARSRDALRAIDPPDRRNPRADRAHARHRSAVLAELPR